MHNWTMKFLKQFFSNSVCKKQQIKNKQNIETWTDAGSRFHDLGIQAINAAEATECGWWKRWCDCATFISCWAALSSSICSIHYNTATTNSNGSPHSTAECKVLDLIPVPGSQPASEASHKPGGRLPLLSATPAVTLATLRGLLLLLPILLLGE